MLGEVASVRGRSTSPLHSAYSTRASTLPTPPPPHWCCMREEKHYIKRLRCHFFGLHGKQLISGIYYPFLAVLTMCSAACRSRAFNIADSTLTDRPNLRAILFPISTSARYSVSLDENNSVPYVDNVKNVNSRLPSPDTSSSEDEGDESRKQSNHHRRNKSTVKRGSSSRSKSRHVSEPWKGGDTQDAAVIPLDQAEGNVKFTLGSAASNDVVLKHPTCADENMCYINMNHGQLYPDPDSSSLVLFNGSATLFYAHSITGPSIKRTIAKNQEATLECGRWIVTVGEGLEFELEILPWTPSKIQGELEIISPAMVTYSSRQERQLQPEPPADTVVERASAPSPEHNITTSRPELCVQRVIKSEQTKAARQCDSHWRHG